MLAPQLRRRAIKRIRAMSSVLLSVIGGSDQQRLFLKPSQTLTLGTSPLASCRVADPKLLPIHLRMSYINDALFVETMSPDDLFELNGTSTDRARITSESTIQVSETTIHVTLWNEEASNSKRKLDPKPATPPPPDNAAPPTPVEPIQETPAQEKPIQAKPVDEEPAPQKTALEKPVPKETVQEKPAEEKTAEKEPTPEKPIQEPPAQAVSEPPPLVSKKTTSRSDTPTLTLPEYVDQPTGATYQLVAEKLNDVLWSLELSGPETSLQQALQLEQVLVVTRKPIECSAAEVLYHEVKLQICAVHFSQLPFDQLKNAVLIPEPTASREGQDLGSQDAAAWREETVQQICRYRSTFVSPFSFQTNMSVADSITSSQRMSELDWVLLIFDDENWRVTTEQSPEWVLEQGIFSTSESIEVVGDDED